MIPLTGYTDRLSAAPGERIAFKISSAARGPYRASLARVVHADPNPAGPGVKTEDLASRFSIERPSRPQPLALGSYARVDAAATLSLPGPLTVSAVVWPTLAAGDERCVIARWDEAGRSGWALSVGPGGATARIGLSSGEPRVLATGRPLELRRWYRIWVVVDLAAGTVRVGQLPLDGQAPGARHETTAPLGAAPRLDAAAAVSIGARLAPGPSEHWNGKIEDPLLLGAVVAAPETLALEPGLPPLGLVAGWDFSQGIEGLDVVDIGPHGLGGRLVNLPTRAVTGARWTGREMCWRHAPREYAAIHFHDDDVYDAGWATDFELTVPEGMRSGAYLMRLAAEGHVEELPFYVRPPRGRRTADVLVIASTYTYQAYANHARGNTDAALRERMAAWGAYPHNPDDHPEYGRSTYNRHRDGSGICYSSRLRPVLTLRPRYLTFLDPRGSGLRHYSADTHLLDWLEAQGIAFDIVTDEDVEAEGAALLAPYATVLTGSHPEYHTPRTREAHAGYLAGGGRLVYLGGNGFYWRIATSPSLPGVIEVRRAETGIRAWEARVGEYYHALDGAYGGLWRRNGHPPQELVGVGFSAQGLFEGSYYRRAPGADDPRAAWIFAGVDDTVIGNFGLSGGGAAGFELDRADPVLGTPPGAIVVASSEGHGPSFVVVFEDLLNHLQSATGERPARLVRADMTYAELPGGGALFAVGSITFCGSLSHNRYDNNVSRILRNVIDRFRLPPAPRAL
ncbi:MAG TPA: N,N-dimethylformamidase beta subunit family domain-containing protein [Candidatus Bathyarchaeia archaeon]|nr:N,N-dimethylformamidase beta subunit family domain-containing protein [Candidatus Bathyarchaeia archaeon]